MFIGIIGRKFIVFHSRNSSESAIPMICLLVFLSSVNILLHLSKYKISSDSQGQAAGQQVVFWLSFTSDSLWIPRVARAVLSLMLTPKDYSMQSVERETEKPKNNNCAFPQDLLWMLSSRTKFGKNERIQHLLALSLEQLPSKRGSKKSSNAANFFVYKILGKRPRVSLSI